MLFAVLSLTFDECGGNCITTEQGKTVTCKNVDLSTITELNLTNVETLGITMCNLPNVPPFIFSNCSTDTSKELGNMKKLFLNGNAISEISEHAFECLPNLDTLSLANNSWFVRNNTKVFKPIPKLKKLDLNGAFDHMYNETTRIVIRLSRVFYETNLDNLEELHLNKNNLLVFTAESSDTLCRFTKLKYLDLSQNYLGKVSLSACNKELVYLNLSANSFERITKEELQIYDNIQKFSPNFTINLKDNNWDCDCNLKDFVKWLKLTNVTVVYKEHYRCHDGLSFNKTLVKLDDPDLVCRSYPMSEIVKTPIIVMGMILAVVCIVLIIALFTKRRSVKNWFKKFKGRESGRNDGYAIVS